MSEESQVQAVSTEPTLTELYRARVEGKANSSDRAMKSQLELLKALSQTVAQNNDNDAQIQIEVRQYRESSGYSNNKDDEGRRKILLLYIKELDKQIAKLTVKMGPKSEGMDGYTLIFSDNDKKDQSFEITDDSLGNFSEKFKGGLADILASKQDYPDDLTQSKINHVFKLG